MPHYANVCDLVLSSGVRLGIFKGKDQTLNLIIDRPDSFQTVRLTHAEARAVAYRLLGSSDPYADAKGG